MTRVLVANRGEIAVRVVERLPRLGFEAVVAVSAADRRLAGRTTRRPRSVHRPGRGIAVIPAAGAARPGRRQRRRGRRSPRVRLLSEKAELAELLEERGDRVRRAATRHAARRRRQGDRPGGRRARPASRSRRAARRIADLAALAALADRIGYPVLLKAVHGGGGRGIHLVDGRRRAGPARRPAQPPRRGPASATARSTSSGSTPPARHVEVQVFGDGQGGVLVLGDRDCSVQRRHQKLVEECPAPDLVDRDPHAAARERRRLGAHLRYRGAGTVEFLVDTDPTRSCSSR